MAEMIDAAQPKPGKRGPYKSDQMSRKSNIWLPVATTLDRAPSEPILCPSCQAATLVVYDIPFGDEGRFERWVHCPACKEGTQILYGPQNSN